MDLNELLCFENQEGELVIEPEIHPQRVSLHEILTKMGLKFAIMQESDKDEGFTAEIRAQVPKAEDDNYSSQCDTWVNQFSRVTGTQWLVTQMFPNSERWYHFRKVYVCQQCDHIRSLLSKKKGPKQGNPARKSKSPRATIDVTIRKNTPNTRRWDTLMRAGLQTKILVDFVHSHSVAFPEDLNLLPGPEDEEEAVTAEAEEPAPVNHLLELEREFRRLRTLTKQCNATAVAALVDVLKEIQTPKHLEHFSFTSKAVATISTHPTSEDNAKQKTWFIFRSEKDPS